VPEIVFEVITFVFQDVECLVLGFPPGSGAVGGRGDSGFVDRQAGDEGALIGDLALGIGDGQADPVDETGIRALAQGNIVDLLQTPSANLAALDITDRAVFSCGPGDESIESLVGGGFGGGQEVAAGFAHGLGDWRAGKHIIAQIDGAQVPEALAMGG
jgi:hypothetical protein